MDCTATTANPASDLKRPATALIELDGVVHEDGKLLALFSNKKHHWQVLCKAADLQSFSRFQAKVADELGLWISHWSQDEPRARTRDEDWADAVRAVFSRRRRA